MYHQSTQLPLMVNDDDDDEGVVHSVQPPGGCPDCSRTYRVDKLQCASSPCHPVWATGRIVVTAEPASGTHSGLWVKRDGSNLKHLIELYLLHVSRTNDITQEWSFQHA